MINRITLNNGFQLAGLVFLLMVTTAFCQSHLGIGVEYGIWKPSSLDDYTSQPFKNIDGADPYYGVSLLSPVFKSHAIRVSLMQWQQNDLVEVDLTSITLRHLSFDLKYVLIPDYSISPFVSYGAAAIWSRETPRDSEGEKIPLDRAGWGFNLGAGVDFLLGAHVRLGIEYQYLYAIFSNRVGLTHNYIGPKFSIKLYYHF